MKKTLEAMHDITRVDMISHVTVFKMYQWLYSYISVSESGYILEQLVSVELMIQFKVSKCQIKKILKKLVSS